MSSRAIQFFNQNKCRNKLKQNSRIFFSTLKVSLVLKMVDGSIAIEFKTYFIFNLSQHRLCTAQHPTIHALTAGSAM